MSLLKFVLELYLYISERKRVTRIRVSISPVVFLSSIAVEFPTRVNSYQNLNSFAKKKGYFFVQFTLAGKYTTPHQFKIV